MTLTVDTNTRCQIDISSNYVDADFEGVLNWALLSSDSTDSVRESEVANFFSSQTADSLTIPGGYLEEGVTYTVEAYYIGVANFNVSNQVEFTASDTKMIRIGDGPSDTHIRAYFE